MGEQIIELLGRAAPSGSTDAAEEPADEPAA